MAHYIVKLTNKKTSTDYYLMWSTVVDAPITQGMDLASFKSWYKDKYGTSGMEELPARLERVEETGTSSLIDTLDSLISLNRAGDKGRKLSKKGILQTYCINHGS